MVGGEGVVNEGLMVWDVDGGGVAVGGDGTCRVEPTRSNCVSAAATIVVAICLV